MRLLAADEPFSLAPTGGRKAKVTTQLLTRWVKQGIAAWNVRDVLTVVATGWLQQPAGPVWTAPARPDQEVTADGEGS